MNSLKYLITFNASCNFVKRSCGSNFSFHQMKRQLYSPASLKLDTVDLNKSIRSPEHLNSGFIEKMKKLTEGSNNDVVFSSDLIKMLRIIKSDDDLTLFLNMLRKFAKQSTTIQFSSFKFGPPVMRLLHILQKPKEALALTEEEAFSKILSPVSCKIILFDLLYENQMYDDIIRLFNEDPSKHQGSALLTLYFAACWKANTANSYKAALESHAYFTGINRRLPVMAKNFLALLCLEQNNPAAAYELIDNSDWLIPTNIRARALAKTGRLKDLFSLLEQMMEKKEQYRNCRITLDTVNFISEELDKANLQQDEKKKWNQIFQILEENQFLDHKSLEENIRGVMFRKFIYRKPDVEPNPQA